MFLAVDIGNTHTVLAVHHGNKWIHTYRISSSLSEEEFHASLIEWRTQKCQNFFFTGSGISSVVPRLTPMTATILQNEFGVPPLIVSHDLNLGITIHYDDPSRLGKDRICSSVAAHAKYKGPLIVVDFGTATTYDCLTSDGKFLGGVIAPGIETAMISLAQRAAQLPLVPLEVPPSVINRNTITSIQAGVLFGAIDAFERMIERLSHELKHFDTASPTIVATGGFSSLIANHTSLIHAVEPMLVLDGIYHLWQRMNG